MHSIGIDIQDIDAFRVRTMENSERFYRRVFTESEIEYCLTKRNPAQHFAARFAAKEAAIKALAPRRIAPREIEVRNTKSGKPEITLHRTGALPPGHKLEISLTHTPAYAAAAALLHPE
jgi:holo-[acyl-carrier protein] synthase